MSVSTIMVPPTGTGDAEVQTSFRMPKTLLKRLKRIALDNDISLAALALEAFEDIAKKYEK